MSLRYSWLHRRLSQEYTYWAPSGIDAWSKRTYYSPVTISGRWEDTTQEFFTPEGENLFSKAVIYTLADVLPAGYLYKGISTATDPTTVSGAQPVQRLDKIQDIAFRTTLIKVYL